MKTRILSVILASILIFTLSACNLRDILHTAERIEEKIENTGDRIENSVENEIKGTFTPDTSTASITEDAARDIALDHAGLTAEEVTGITVRYDLDDGVPEYEVKFYHDRFEYDYDIHAETGDIRSVDRDD